MSSTENARFFPPEPGKGLTEVEVCKAKSNSALNQTPKQEFWRVFGLGFFGGGGGLVRFGYFFATEKALLTQILVREEQGISVGMSLTLDTSQMCVNREMKRLRHKVIGDNEFNLCYAVLGDRAGARVLALTLQFYGNNRKYHLNMFPWGRVCIQGPQEGGIKEVKDLSLGKDARRFSDEQSIISVFSSA